MYNDTTYPEKDELFYVFVLINAIIFSKCTMIFQSTKHWTRRVIARTEIEGKLKILLNSAHEGPVRVPRGI